ncbi:MAG: sulfite exporter TauE/SafE family protein, partial [Nanoarchaeota archaeon]|nr:sulfite exporter TauE/SafE family protein [Nanoarchaeota archaeon]
YSGVYFGPMMTGLLNGLFIACGPLQALYLYAAGTGSVVQGGISLMAFGLGTLPVMLGFGGIANLVSSKATKKILKVSAIIVLILGLIMLNRGLALTGTGYDVNSIITGAQGVAAIGGQVYMDGNYQVIKMNVDRYGWDPDSFVLKKDVPVKWVINGEEITGCNNAIQVPKLNLKFDIKEGVQTIEFTPTEEGVIPWSCWMGMISGTFIVTDDGVATQSQLADADSQAVASGSCSGGAGGGSCGSPSCGASQGTGGCGCGG